MLDSTIGTKSCSTLDLTGFATHRKEVLTSIMEWDHWSEIELGVAKEYGMSSQEFQAILPEYWKFMGLIALGHTSLGMFSTSVDKIWHAHILNMPRYAT